MSLVAWIQLLLIGFAIGACLLLILWWKSKTFSFHRLVLLTVFFTFDLILFGAFTRLTDSGLGCPDWPGCYGLSNPVAALNQIREAENLMPTGPVTLSKAWIEMLHRYFAMGVGFLIIVISVWAWLKRQQFGFRIAITSSLILLLVCVQGAFGAWTVTLKLQPIIVTTHLMLGLSLLASLTYLSSLSSKLEHGVYGHQKVSSYRMNRGSIWFALMVLIIQIFLGGWVSTNYAVLACDDFPLCHGSFFPAMNFSEGFGLWRELGKTVDGVHLSIEGLRAIHWAHRMAAVFALSVLFYLGFKTLRAAIVSANPELRRWAFALLSLCIIQLITGMSNIILDWPLVAALLHTGGAAAILVVLVRMLTLSAEEFDRV
jgi:cytochrome c oxidase assembly protein subunit 15